MYSIPRFNARKYPLPEVFRTTLVYFEQINFVAVTTPQLYIFRGNGPYDPNQTGTGSQPVGYDNLATFYSSIGTVASRITITLMNNTQTVVQLALAPTLASNTVSSYEQLRYFGKAVKLLDLDGTSRGGRSHGKIIHTGVSVAVVGKPWDNDFSSLVTAVPYQQWYWTIAFQNSDQASNLSVNMQVTLEYDVVYSAPKFVTLS